MFCSTTASHKETDFHVSPREAVTPGRILAQHPQMPALGRVKVMPNASCRIPGLLGATTKFSSKYPTSAARSRGHRVRSKPSTHGFAHLSTDFTVSPFSEGYARKSQCFPQPHTHRHGEALLALGRELERILVSGKLSWKPLGLNLGQRF